MESGVRVNCIAPGTVDTPWISRITSGYDDPEKARANMQARQPHGRFVAPEEIAAMAAYLASDESASVIGACMVVDGGVTAQVSEAHRRTVEAGYDQMAEQYLATKNPQDPLALAALEDLSSFLPHKAAVLDLGCGAGIPATRWLADRGFAVTSVDVSARQLELARRNVPEATLLKADMAEVTFAPETFDAVVAFHSIIHVPRADHAGATTQHPPLARAARLVSGDHDRHRLRGQRRRLGRLGGVRWRGVTTTRTPTWRCCAR